MRIDSFNPVNGIAPENSAQQLSSKPGASTASHGSEDRTTLSADSVSISSLAAKALESPAVRQDKVDAFRQSVSRGEYQIEPSKIAASMVDESA
jgi:negative regulator of flagellin synthesis FlgM